MKLIITNDLKTVKSDNTIAVSNGQVCTIRSDYYYANRS